MKNYRYTVFTEKIESDIKRGVLKSGDKLPSVRLVKKEYGLSTTSVQSGYDYLVYKGYVTSIPRSGYTVAESRENNNLAECVDLKSALPDPEFRENIVLTGTGRRLRGTTFLNSAVPSDSFIPQKLILKTMQQVVREKGAALLRYYPSGGAYELRYLISQRLSTHGALIHPDELIITEGALQSLFISLSVTTVPNDIVAVESPCVFSVLEVITNLGLRILEVPVKAGEGMDTDYLRKVCKKNNIKAIVLTPNFHNPTGILMTDEKKKEVCGIAVFHNIPIIENDVYGDLYFSNTRPSNIRNFDDSGLVITFSSFSKTLAPGIRLGWLAPGRFFPKAERLKFSLGRSVSPLNQELMIKLLETAAYDRHLRTFRAQLEQQSVQFVEQFNTYFLGNICTHVPEGGYSIWNRLSEKTNMELFYRNCEKLGIRFTPGSTFSYKRSYGHYFRTVISQKLIPSDLEAIKKLGQSLKT